MDKETPNRAKDDEIGKGKEGDDHADLVPPESNGVQEDVRSSNRPKAPTDKMREYRRQLQEKDFETSQRACSKQVKETQ